MRHTAGHRPELDRDRRRLVLVAAACVAVGIVVYPIWAPGTYRRQYDHVLFLRTAVLMRRGEGFYSATAHAFASGGIPLGRARAFRLPTVFLVWRMIPPSLLHATFLVLVVGGTSLLALRLTSTPQSAVIVAGYLLTSSQLPTSHGAILSWALVEYWALPLVFASLLAHRAARWWWAAALACLAALTRETTAPLLLGGLLFAQRRKLPRWPWLAMLGVFVSALGVHLIVASGHTVAHGTDAPLLGTGHFPTSVTHMVTYRPVLPLGATLAIWAMAWWRVKQLQLLPLVGPILAIPLLGLFVERPYWGVVVMPFVLMWATELTAGSLRRASSRVRTTAEGSSTRPRIPGPA